jgi:hypothetical protein
MSLFEFAFVARKEPADVCSMSEHYQSRADVGSG